jgi:hypothetical protein
VVNDEPYMLQFNDHVEVPLYPRPEADPQEFVASLDSLDPVLREQLANAGLEVQPDIRFITGQVPDGRPFIVPVQQLRIQSRVQ